MSVSRNVLSALVAAAAVGKANAAFGSSFSTGPTSDDTFIAESWATLNLPDAPTDNSGDLSLWVGMGTSAGDLIQSIADNTADTEDWSLFAYTLVSTSDTTQEPIIAEASSTTAGTAVTFHYLYDADTGNYTQDVIVDGSIVSTLSTSDGTALGWGSAVECAAEDCGTVPAHTWTNVSIILSGAYTGYIDTLALGEGVDATMTSADGITWEVGTISIPGYDFSTSAITDDVAATTTTSTTTTDSASTSSSSSAPSGAASPSGTTTTGAQSSGAPDGSSTWGAAGAQSSGSGYGGHGGHHGGWSRSRISRHADQN